MLLSVPIELWPEVSSLSIEEARDLHLDFESAIQEGQTPAQIADVMAGGGFSREFADWYVSQGDRPAATQVYFEAPPGPASLEISDAKNDLLFKGVWSAIAGMLLFAACVVFSHYFPPYAETAGLVGGVILEVQGGWLLAKSKGLPPFYGPIMMILCQIVGLLILLKAEDERAFQEAHGHMVSR